ncbi:hypothetical protein HDU96_001702 [Phlyctochytrium bullatum]|nr:hypothetical protein HDU96_001702 [Phlyctochytrium bullatum]
MYHLIRLAMSFRSVKRMEQALLYLFESRSCPALRSLGLAFEPLPTAYADYLLAEAGEETIAAEFHYHNSKFLNEGDIVVEDEFDEETQTVLEKLRAEEDAAKEKVTAVAVKGTAEKREAEDIKKVAGSRTEKKAGKRRPKKMKAALLSDEDDGHLASEELRSEENYPTTTADNEESDQDSQNASDSGETREDYDANSQERSSAFGTNPDYILSETDESVHAELRPVRKAERVERKLLEKDRPKIFTSTKETVEPRDAKVMKVAEPPTLKPQNNKPKPAADFPLSTARSRQLAIAVPFIKALELDSMPPPLLTNKAGKAAGPTAATAAEGGVWAISVAEDDEGFGAYWLDGVRGLREETRTARVVEAIAKFWSLLPDHWRQPGEYMVSHLAVDVEADLNGADFPLCNHLLKLIGAGSKGHDFGGLEPLVKLIVGDLFVGKCNLDTLMYIFDQLILATYETHDDPTMPPFDTLSEFLYMLIPVSLPSVSVDTLSTLVELRFISRYRRQTLPPDLDSQVFGIDRPTEAEQVAMLRTIDRAKRRAAKVHAKVLERLYGTDENSKDVVDGLDEVGRAAVARALADIEEDEEDKDELRTLNEMDLVDAEKDLEIEKQVQKWLDLKKWHQERKQRNMAERKKQDEEAKATAAAEAATQSGVTEHDPESSFLQSLWKSRTDEWGSASSDVHPPLAPQELLPAPTTDTEEEEELNNETLRAKARAFGDKYGVGLTLGAQQQVIEEEEEEEEEPQPLWTPRQLPLRAKTLLVEPGTVFGEEPEHLTPLGKVLKAVVDRVNYGDFFIPMALTIAVLDLYRDFEAEASTRKFLRTAYSILRARTLRTSISELESSITPTSPSSPLSAKTMQPSPTTTSSAFLSEHSQSALSSSISLSAPRPNSSEDPVLVELDPLKSLTEQVEALCRFVAETELRHRSIRRRTSRRSSSAPSSEDDLDFQEEAMAERRRKLIDLRRTELLEAVERRRRERRATVVALDGAKSATSAAIKAEMRADQGLIDEPAESKQQQEFNPGRVFAKQVLRDLNDVNHLKSIQGIIGSVVDKMGMIFKGEEILRKTYATASREDSAAFLEDEHVIWNDLLGESAAAKGALKEYSPEAVRDLVLVPDIESGSAIGDSGSKLHIDTSAATLSRARNNDATSPAVSQTPSTVATPRNRRVRNRTMALRFFGRRSRSGRSERRFGEVSPLVESPEEESEAMSPLSSPVVSSRSPDASLPRRMPSRASSVFTDHVGSVEERRLRKLKRQFLKRMESKRKSRYGSYVMPPLPAEQYISEFGMGA